jgi:L-iditol 2-dehydrogenase
MAANPVYRFDFGKLQAKEASITTVFRYRNIYPAAIKAVGEKLIDVKQIVSDVYGLSEVEKAVEHAINHASETVKIVIDMNK